MNARKLALAAAEVPAVPFVIPGATGEFRIQLLNQESGAGVVTSIIHLPPGGRIPAHRHGAGAEMHYVLEGDLVEQGRELGAGAFLTHAAGQVHGPHESRGGAKVLKVQSWQSEHGAYDFEPADSPGDEGGAPDGMHKVDEAAQEEARRPESGRTARGYS
jgi:quercetin dioxygenase-like cupin family protein